MAADNTLEAFQLGASLYDRAQTQKRMMNQLQLQSNQQLMQQRSAELQNRIQENALAQSLKEQEARANATRAVREDREAFAQSLKEQEARAKEFYKLPNLNQQSYTAPKSPQYTAPKISAPSVRVESPKVYTPPGVQNYSASIVRPYVKSNGTYVSPSFRSTPNQSVNDNWSTQGNYNPFNGAKGTKRLMQAGELR